MPEQPLIVVIDYDPAWPATFAALRAPLSAALRDVALSIESAALANHLAVRDYRRAHPDVASAYGQLKKRLAVEFSADRAGYGAGKAEFVLRVLASVGRSGRLDAPA